MSSTNKTTNYELSQFIGADKPAWLSDYNTDMSKIDAGVHSAQTTATGADGKADTNATNIGTLSNLSTTAKTNLVAAINEVDTNADAAQQSADTANTTASGAATAVENLAKYLDLKNFNTLTISVSGGATINVGDTNFHSAYNDGGTLGKIWGTIQLAKTNNQDTTVTLSDTGFRPTTAFTITDGILLEIYGNYSEMRTIDLTVNTDGTATCVVPGWTNGQNVRVINQPYMIIGKKFNA